MTTAQRKAIETAGLDVNEFFATPEGWSHNGFVAWQLETCAESKRETDSEDAKVADVLRQLDELED